MTKPTNFEAMYLAEIASLKSRIERYKADPYYSKFIPQMEKKRAYYQEELNKIKLAAADNTSEQKAIRAKSSEGAALLAQLQPLASSQPKYGEKPAKGAIVQRITPIKLTFPNGKTAGFGEVAMAVCASNNQLPQRLGYLNVDLFVNGRTVHLNGRFALPNLVAFADNVLRWGPLTTRPSRRLKLHHQELWEKHGNHKVLHKRPVLDLFNRQKAKSEWSVRTG